MLKTLVNFEDVILSEISRSQKDKYYIPRIWISKDVKFKETESEVVVAGVWGGGSEESIFPVNRHRGSVWEDENGLEREVEVMVALQCDCVSCH